jgi:uncharacterized membrane protein
MSRFSSSRFAIAFALALGSWSSLAVAQEYRYRYASIAEAKLPPGIVFFDPQAINNGGQIGGIAYDESFMPHVAIYSKGVVTALEDISFGFRINQGGTIAGSVVVDPVNSIEQAALFHGSKVELIPRLPGEVTSEARLLADTGEAVVNSFDESSNLTRALYKNGQVTPLDFGPSIPFALFLDINNNGIISGTTFVADVGYRGFRFNTRTGESTLLDPLPTEPHSWALGINESGDVLGYSFVFGAIERIGVWNKKGDFQTYFVEGTPEFPTVSNRLVFNNNNLIAISVTSDGNSYLVPRPGVRLNLNDLVTNPPQGSRVLNFISGMNDHGDLIGFGSAGSFFLERTGAD